VVAKLQTHWVKTVKNALFWLNGSALWRNFGSGVVCVLAGEAVIPSAHPIDRTLTC